MITHQILTNRRGAKDTEEGEERSLFRSFGYRLSLFCLAQSRSEAIATQNLLYLYYIKVIKFPMITNNNTQMKSNQYPFAEELITDTQGNIRKVIIDFQDYLRLLEAIEDEGLILAIKEVQQETPLNINEALAELERE